MESVSTGTIMSSSESSSFVLRCKRLSEHAALPTRAHDSDAGYDLYAAYDMTVPPYKTIMVKTDIAIAVPEGYYGRIAPRSSLAYKHGIRVEAGVIDAGYRNNVGVLLSKSAEGGAEMGCGFTGRQYIIKKGDRIAQLIITKIATPKIVEVETLDDTSRGQGGFGSTGR